jgi:NAD(P)H dehydrogenase (quinone)
MKLGVSGASGKLGGVVLDKLVKSGGGHSVVGISRSPDTLPSPIQGRRGDYDDPASLVSAYEGLDRLLLIASADLRPGVRGGQLRTAIDAATQAGVSRVVLMSAAGTREAPTVK